MSFRPARKYATAEESRAARRATNQRCYAKRREHAKRYNAQYYGLKPHTPVKWAPSQPNPAIRVVHPSVHLPLKGSIALSLAVGFRRKVA